MNVIKELWAYCPGEVAAYGAIAALCGLVFALCVIGLLAPVKNEMDEVI